MAPTQAALYADLDLELSWSEQALPERERTKHVHRLHPYLGKFIPQLVEVLLSRYFRPRQHVLDPFAGSGTTLVQALESGLDATGVDIAAFNCLLMDVKTRPCNAFVLEHELREVHARIPGLQSSVTRPSGFVRRWYAPQAARELLAFREIVEEFEHADVLRVILARAARSARRTTHFDLDFPPAPQLEPYWCHKHKRICRPVETSSQFLRRYTLDTLHRVKSFAAVRKPKSVAHAIHGDARTVRYEGVFDGIVTSPPYPGLIDYHEQHRYAYELLGLDDRRDSEIGAASSGIAKSAIADYCDGIVQALTNAVNALKPRAPVIIVVNDRRELYPDILERAGLGIEECVRRHVNRRTGRRAGEFFEDVIVARVL